MQATFDAMGIELLKHGYRKVVFLEVECKIDGTYRLGISAELPIGDHFECPQGHEQRPCSGILAVGYSKKSLPLEPEFWYGRGNRQIVSENEWKAPVTRPTVDGRARHYRKTFQVGSQEAIQISKRSASA